ncbi:hypothetical protein REC12_24905 [Desulfosporosinus sp. PR]|uniref:hypothetical protein n=1 Tax=Candidatus Desulfosporosinus nitrosoreducens TaxID=3401928 RepID=UPI0027EB1AD6|nr:hypothetical protein [Desulfosporosinus sp. PR]MDQ7096838.1 hypothetical protein [Desulfosporosinus sp. PR]
MNFPYGEWILMFVTLVTWIEKQASRWFFLKLSMIWLVGKCLEGMIPLSSSVWHWHYARLAVLLYVFGCAWKQAQRRVWPLLLTSFVLSMETLFLVNDPGVIPYSSWLFALALVTIAWLSAKSYWGTVLALTGSVLWGQGLERFVYEGIFRHVDLPDGFIWNFGVLVLMGWGIWRFRRSDYSESAEMVPSVEALVPASDKGIIESAKDRELQ